MSPTPNRRPFRASDVLTGSIDTRPAPPARVRKQISAQLEPGQLRLLGELHARLNATGARRIEKSDLVGLGIELLAAVLAEADTSVHHSQNGAHDRPALNDIDDIRSYLRTHVRAYVK